MGAAPPSPLGFIALALPALAGPQRQALKEPANQLARLAV